MTSSTSATLNDLIQVLNDGEAFYADAASKPELSAYRSLFQRMARTKQSIANDLKTQVASHGEKPSKSGTVFGTLRAKYTELRANFGHDQAKVYVAQLEQAEDAILESFESHLKDTDNAEVRAIITRYMPEVLSAHNEMRDLKVRLAA